MSVCRRNLLALRGVKAAQGTPEASQLSYTQLGHTMAGFNNTSKNAALSAIILTGKYISLHTADPGATGASEVTGAPYARQLTTWGAVTGSQVVGSQVTIPVPNGATVVYWGVWDAATGGSFWEGGSLPASQFFSGNGTYQLTVTLTATG